jgi:hypothetical protein
MVVVRDPNGVKREAGGVGGPLSREGVR